MGYRIYLVYPSCASFLADRTGTRWSRAGAGAGGRGRAQATASAHSPLCTIYSYLLRQLQTPYLILIPLLQNLQLSNCSVQGTFGNVCRNIILTIHRPTHTALSCVEHDSRITRVENRNYAIIIIKDHHLLLEKHILVFNFNEYLVGFGADERSRWRNISSSYIK